VEARPRDVPCSGREPDGCEVCAFLPVEQPVVSGSFDVLAQAPRAPKERTIDQIRADTFVDLICHATNPPATYEAQILVPSA